MTEGRVRRAELAGTWMAGALTGRFSFSAGLQDDYLELELAMGRFPGSVVECDTVRPVGISLQTFAEGRGLSIFLPLEKDTPGLAAEPPERLQTLVQLLTLALPGLQASEEGAGSVEDRSLGSVAEPAEGQDEEERSQFGSTPPGSGRSLLGDAVVALERGRLGEATHLAHQAEAVSEQGVAEFLEALGKIRQATRLTRRDPRSAQGHLTLAFAYFLADASQGVLREARRAMQLNPSLGQEHALLALEYWYRGNQQGALAAYDRARALLPANDESLRCLARALVQAGLRVHSPGSWALLLLGLRDTWWTVIRTVIRRLGRWARPGSRRGGTGVAPRGRRGRKASPSRPQIKGQFGPQRSRFRS